MTIFQSLIKKETLHVVRDTRTMLITIIMPLVLLLLFGFAISTEVNSVRVVAVVDQHTDQTKGIIEQFQVNEYFCFVGMVGTEEVDGILRAGKADAAVFLHTDDGKLASQIIVDASNTTIAQASTGYIQNVINGNVAFSPISTRILYNPQLKSAYNFVPGILGMIFILICAIMTSVSIVSEKENGTMNLLLVSPVNPSTIILGKLVPYFFLSCIILTAMLTISYTVLELPLSGNIASVVFLSLIYIVLSLSIGLLVSTIVDTQLTALIVSAMIFMLPVIMLSGMIFPVDNMPILLQWVSCIIPARWYIAAMRKLMIQQLDLVAVWQETIILLGMAFVLIMVAVRKFNTRS